MSKAKRCIETGMWIALTMAANSAPLRCYVGEVQAVDDCGVRITLIDWIVGAACGYDFFAPWAQIVSALVATSEHDLSGFGKEAARWQDRCGEMLATGETP